MQSKNQPSKGARLIFAILIKPPKPTDRKFFFFSLAITGVSQLHNGDPDLRIAK